MKDDTLDSTYLFITDSKWTQWRLLLERRTTGYTWGDITSSFNPHTHEGRSMGQNFPPKQDREQTPKRQSSNESTNLPMDESGVSNSGSDSSKRESFSSLSTEPKRADVDDNEEVGRGGRSRLAGLKQLSFASLTNIRQKISEGRRLLASSSTKVIGANNNTSGSDFYSFQGNASSQEGCKSAHEGKPEALNAKVGGTRLSIQQAATSKSISQGSWGKSTPPQGMVLAGLFPETAILTFHNIELEVLPQVIQLRCTIF